MFDEEYKSRSSSLCTYFLPLGSFFLITLFSNILNLCSSLNIRDQVSFPHKTTGKLIVLCILIFYVNTQETVRQNNSAVAASVLHI